MTSVATNKSEIPVKKKVWQRIDIWALLIFLLICGGVAGSTITQYFILKEANLHIEELSKAYEEAANARNETMQMCLSQTKGAALEAAQAAEAAQRAARNAASVVSSEINK